MARLGQFQFGIDTAAFQQLQRSASYQWQAKNRVGRKPAQQFTGQGADTITLNGVIYPHYRGGIGQLGFMREIAGTGQPQPLVYTLDSVGQYCGRWCITSIEETRTVFFDNGAPRKIEFSLTLVEYGEDAGSLAAAGAASLAAKMASVAATKNAATRYTDDPVADLAFTQIKALAGDAFASAGGIAANLTTQLAAIQEHGAALGTRFNAVKSAVVEGFDAATGVKGSGAAALRLLGNVPQVSRITTAAKTVGDESTKAVNTASRSSATLSEAFGAAVTSETPDELVLALRSASRSTSDLAKLASTTAISSKRIQESVAS